MLPLSRSSPLLNLIAAVVILAGFSWIGLLSWQRESRVATALTGLPQSDGQPLPVLTGGGDSYYWQWVVQKAVKDHAWRTRKTDLDNAPFGRNVCWSSVPLWWMRGWTALFQVARGVPAESAVGLATELTGPLLHAAILLLFTGFTWRVRGPLPAMLVAFAVLAPTISFVEMSSGNVDHHGWQELSAGGMLLCLYLGGLGWVSTEGNGPYRVPTRSIARRWFLLAGVLGALGIAISANQGFIFLAVTGAGALIAQWHSSRLPQNIRLDSSLWRDWALAGGAVSLILFIVENEPDHLLSRHLETNHPFYGLAWIAGGMLLWEIRPEAGGWSAVCSKPFRNLLWVILLVLPVAAYACGGAQWHIFRDPELSSLNEEIQELMPAWVVFDLKTTRGWWFYQSRTGFVMIPLIVGLWVWTRPRANRGDLLLWRFTPLLFPVGFLLLALTFAQNRWMSLLSLSALPIWLWLWDGAGLAQSPRKWQALSTALCVLAAVGGGIATLQEQPSVNDLAGQAKAADIFRSAGMAMVRQSGQAHPVIMGDTAFYQMVFVSPARYVASAYWENAEGLRDLFHFSITDKEEEFRQILDRRCVQYIAVKPNPSLVLRGSWARYGHYDAEQVRKAIAWKLCKPHEPLPTWLQECTEELDPRLNQIPMRVFRYQSKETGLKMTAQQRNG